MVMVNHREFQRDNDIQVGDIYDPTSSIPQRICISSSTGHIAKTAEEQLVEETAAELAKRLANKVAAGTMDCVRSACAEVVDLVRRAPGRLLSAFQPRQASDAGDAMDDATASSQDAFGQDDGGFDDDTSAAHGADVATSLFTPDLYTHVVAVIVVTALLLVLYAAWKAYRDKLTARNNSLQHQQQHLAAFADIAGAATRPGSAFAPYQRTDTFASGSAYAAVGAEEVARASKPPSPLPAQAPITPADVASAASSRAHTPKYW
jgi:hypothetical protein